MINSKIKEFFYPGNAVHGEPDYGLADNFVRTVEAFANTTFQSVYIILRLCLLYQNLTLSASKNHRK